MEGQNLEYIGNIKSYVFALQALYKQTMLWRRWTISQGHQLLQGRNLSSLPPPPLNSDIEFVCIILYITPSTYGC